jgi:hypothetical protein
MPNVSAAPTLPTAGARALLAGLFDYAGLFPPAALDLDDALAHWRRHRDEPAAWMLGALVLPVRLLPDLAERLHPHEGVPLTLLPTGGTPATAWIDALHADLGSITEFGRTAPDCAVTALETRLPADAQGDAAHATIARAAKLMRDFGLDRAVLFLECGWTDEEQRAFPATLAAIAACNAEAEAPTLAAKLRMGGVTADAFPSTAAVARALRALADAGVPFKCTAGLHHPVRAWNEGVQTEMHGFLNVFAAATFAQSLGADVDTLDAVLSTTDADAFRVDAGGVQWQSAGQSLHATPEQLRRARSWARGIGSCSFDEPVDDLSGLAIATG